MVSYPFAKSICRKKYSFENLEPVNCQWGPWSIGRCSKSCGGGKQIKIRTKTTVEANGGTCDGQPLVIEDCNTNSCSNSAGTGIAHIDPNSTCL